MAIGLENELSSQLVVEGLVIVGSILLAFAIDAGWDAHRQCADEQAVLASLEAEFIMTALVRSKLFFARLYAGELRRLAAHGEKVLAAIRANRD